MSRAKGRIAGVAWVILGALVLPHCGGDSGAGPTAPPGPPVAATPTPTPSATPEPPVSQSCAKLPPGSLVSRCDRADSEYQQIVDRAIRTLQAEQPAIFDHDQVLSVGAYYVGLIKVLDRQGLCASTDHGGEELGVTDGTGSNEQFDILSAQYRVRFGPVSYMTTCRPSAVPFAQGGMLPVPPGCTLPPSREIACGREPQGRYYADVEAAITQIQKDKPELFDPSNPAQGTGEPAVKDNNAYLSGVVEILAKKGYCGRHDGEEIALKIGSNTYNEQYDIDFQNRWVRRGTGIYRSTCYPSSF